MPRLWVVGIAGMCVEVMALSEGDVGRRFHQTDPSFILGWKRGGRFDSTPLRDLSVSSILPKKSEIKWLVLMRYPVALVIRKPQLTKFSL